MFSIRYPTQSDADFRIQETMKLEELRISEYSPPYRLKTKEVGVQHDLSPHPYYRIMTSEVGMQYGLSDACLEEVVVEKLKRVSPKKSEKNTEEVDDEQKSAFSISSDAHNQEDITEFIYPPVLCRKTAAGKRDPYVSLIKIPKRKTNYDSDDTCDTYVECGEKGICKCQRMRGREYYEYYEFTKDKEHMTMYPQGKCVLPRGAVFHFTGAPNTMKREDVKDALIALGAKIEFLDYQSGSKEGWVRLSYKYEARIIIKKMIDKKLNIEGAELVFRVLSGKDEKRYHKKAIEAIFQLQEKAKGLDKKLKKAGYSYVTKYDSDSNK